MPIPRIDRKIQLKNRIILTVFFLGISVGVWLLLTIATPYVESLRKEGVLGQVFYQVIEVPTGDSLVVKHEDDTFLVKLAGIRCPHPAWAHDPEFAGWSWTPNDLAQLGNTASKALSTWVYRRHVALEPPPSAEQIAAGKRIVARATLSKVDLGRKQLQAGQAMMADEPHDWKAIYEMSQQEGFTQQHGLWRFKPQAARPNEL